MLIIHCGGLIIFFREVQDQLAQREKLVAEGKRFVMTTKD